MEEKPTITIQVTKRGPYIIKGEVKLVNEDGSYQIKTGVIALCRCGGSSHKPLCDGTHTIRNFHE